MQSNLRIHPFSDSPENLPTREATLDSPVFVVGPLRSGTTLLRLLLDHHPQMYFFGEFEGAVSQAEGNAWPSIESYHDFVKRDRQMQAHKVLVDTSLEYEDLVHSFLEQIYDTNPQPVVGASVHSRMDLLPRLWPNARFIHLLRDPRDVARSCIGMGWVGNVYEGSSYWLDTERHWDLLCDQIPKANRMSVRYEELVTNPDVVLGEICGFLELPYSPEMLELDKDTSYSRPSGEFANQWKRKLSPREIRWVESRCALPMKERGYELASESPEKPGFWELRGIRLQNRWFRICFNIRRYGLLTWLAFVWTKRFGPRELHARVEQRYNRIHLRYLK